MPEANERRARPYGGLLVAKRAEQGSKFAQMRLEVLLIMAPPAGRGVRVG